MRIGRPSTTTITTLHIVVSVTYYLELHDAITIYSKSHIGTLNVVLTMLLTHYTTAEKSTAYEF